MKIDTCLLGTWSDEVENNVWKKNMFLPATKKISFSQIYGQIYGQSWHGSLGTQMFLIKSEKSIYTKQKPRLQPYTPDCIKD